MNKFDYNDINLIPKKCIVESRSECDTSIQFGPHTFKMPVIPANMSSVINQQLAYTLASEGYFYIMHRFLTDEEQLNFVKNMNLSNLVASISVGVKSTDYDLISAIYNNKLNLNYVTIDIAHGHAETVKNMIAHIKELFPKTFVIAGNVSSIQGVIDLQSWGADAIKVGIASGHSCTTAFATGFGSRNCQASTIMECAQYTKVPIIADGNIVHPADITKAIVLGATMVMAGALFSGCKDSPGEIVMTGDIPTHKKYYGSASQHQSNKSNRIEGTMKYIPYVDRTYLEQMNYLMECLQSSISYGGGNTLKSLNYVQWY